MTRRPRSIAIALISAVAIIAIVVLGGLLSLLPQTGLHCPHPGARVLLDPGHGGDDPGAINAAAGLVERELVLAIARRTAALLEAAGYSVALTRTDNATGYANTPRGLIANACHAFVYVSIHLNSFGAPEPNYAKTFWGIAAKDAAFAAVMQAALVSRLQPGTDLGDAGLEGLENGGLLTARMPAVLVEPVFLSNPAEAARLADPAGERLEAIAAAVASGVDTWLRARALGPREGVGISSQAPASLPDPGLEPATPATPAPSISPETQPLLALLPTQAQVPAELVLADEAERSKEEVVAALGGTEEAAQLLDDWGWSGNVYRDFVANEATPTPNGTTFLNVSVHRFADAESAASAMVYFSDQVISGQGLQEVETPAIGDRARLLEGAPDGVPLAVLYAQQGSVMYRIGGSPSGAQGDPISDVLAVATEIMPGQETRSQDLSQHRNT
ncbi:MAG TPA: N-acetylmuramoyl-L-alanine amidase [Thermomicrobiales bacterium]|nr:N-acetylmuramoyl-L-alanine amidase [Thermomicrobiales bacterium]